MTRTALIVAAVATLIGGCGGSGNSKSGASPAAVSMQGLRFHPALIVIHVGQTVRWTNSDSVDHNVTAISGAAFKSRAFGQGVGYSFVPKRAGTIRYVCTLHPGMNGTLEVN